MARLTPEAPFLHPECEISDTTFGRYCEVGRGTRLANVELGDYSYTDRYADIANARVGKFSNIAAFTRIGATDHPMDKASLHHFLYRSQDYWDDAEKDAAWFGHRASRIAVIGHDTWIGGHAMVKPEVTIGHGAIVAAGAVVTSDVAPYTIVAGVPAVPLRPRYREGVAERMMELAWWDWDHETLRARLDDFRTLSAADFLDRYA
ncbi:chloramphenicol acetyltransferase [Roseobacter sp. HKCCA0434]|uniref:chloramphenicol acetyltransferase n=1 Tax=Roseobacter sp. HKCCA0434 TaxID=3079297 RepID=UPI002905D451|nr:chloramphenicol acetyltransferase [Roseobacter sp. HKCCA0434]